MHGIGGDVLTWAPFAIPFLKSHNVLIPEIRSFGSSLNTPYTSHWEAGKDVNSVIERLVPRGSRIKLIGLSMGAVVSYHYFKQFPDTPVTHFMNVDQSPIIRDPVRGIFGEEHDEMWSKIMSNVEKFRPQYGVPIENLSKELRGDFKNILSQFFEYAFHRKIEKFIVGNFLKSSIFGDLALRKSRAYLFHNYIDIIDHYDSIKDELATTFADLDVSLTLIVGGKSEMFPAKSQLLLGDHARNFRKAVVFDEAHGLMWTSPKAFMKELFEFADA